MGEEWAKQAVTTVNRWDYRYLIADYYKSQLQLSRQLLDQKIESSQLYKHDQTTTVVKLMVADSTLVLKRYNARSFGHAIKRAFRRSRAERCWQMSYVFANAGLNVAPPVFMFEERLWLIRKHAYFSNQCLPGEELLSLLPSMNEEQQSKVVEAFRIAMEIMRKHKISHGDMKASNLLWVDGQLFFIDLDAARQHESDSSWRRANRRDRKRFLKNWHEQPELMALFAWLQ